MWGLTFTIMVRLDESGKGVGHLMVVCYPQSVLGKPPGVRILPTHGGGTQEMVKAGLKKLKKGRGGV